MRNSYVKTESGEEIKAGHLLSIGKDGRIKLWKIGEKVVTRAGEDLTSDVVEMAEDGLIYNKGDRAT